MDSEILTTSETPVSFAEHIAARTATPAEPTVESGTEVEPAVDSETTESSQEKPAKKDRSVEARFADLTRARKEAEEKSARLEQELQGYRTRKPEPEPAAKVETKAVEEDKGPQEADFSTYTEFVEARAEWKAERKAEAKWKEFREKDAAESQQKTAQQQYEENFSKGKAAYTDFDDKLKAAEATMAASGGFQPNPGAHAALTESENPAAIVYHFAENPTECLRIMRLDQQKAYRAIVLLEAKLLSSAPANPEKQKPTPISQAAAPPATVGGPVESTKSTAAPGTSWAEHQRLRRKNTG